MNFATEFSEIAPVTTFTKAHMGAPIVLLDQIATYNRPKIVTCDGLIDYDSATGRLSWSADIHIWFNRTDGDACHNVISGDSDGAYIDLTDNQHAYVDLSETNDAEVAAAVVAITEESASNFLAFNRLVLGYRNSSDDRFYPVALTGIYFPTTVDDLQFSISRGTPGPSAPTWEAFTTNTKEWAFDIGDNIDLECNELAHWWKEGSPAGIHVHVTTNDLLAQEEAVAIKTYIAYQDENNDWQETENDGEVIMPDATPDLRGFYINLGDLTLTDITIGKQVKIRVERIAVSSSEVEYTGDIFINQVGMHLIKDFPGSRTASVK